MSKIIKNINWKAEFVGIIIVLTTIFGIPYVIFKIINLFTKYSLKYNIINLIIFWAIAIILGTIKRIYLKLKR